MLEYYVEIKHVHVAAALASGTLFLVRGLLVLAGRQAWAMLAPVRYASYTIDTVLLTAALMLFSMLPSALFANGWLAAKLALLLPYIVLGSFALKRATTRRGRLLCYLLALAAFAAMLSIATTHTPLGHLSRGG